MRFPRVSGGWSRGIIAALLPLIPAPSSASVTIPFSAKENLVAVEASVLGKPLTFIIDTGVNPSVIDLSVARSLGLASGQAPSGDAGGVGKERSVYYPAELRGLRLGRQKFGSVEAVGFDMTFLSGRFGRRLDGVLGESFLRNRILIIDYPRQKVTIFGSAVEAARAVSRCRARFDHALEFIPDDPTPKLTIMVAQWPVTVTLDTGSVMGLQLYDGALPKEQETRLLTITGARTLGGARGKETARNAVLNETVRLGPFRWDRPPVVLSAGKGSPGSHLGNMGNRFFDGKRLLLDYKNMHVGLYADCEAKAPAIERGERGR